MGEVWVEVDLLGLGEPSAMRTARLKKHAAPLDFRYSQSVSVAAGSKEQTTLRDALTSADEQTSDVYFELKTLNARGDERQVAQGYVNLKKLLADGRDTTSAAISLHGLSLIHI